MLRLIEKLSEVGAIKSACVSAKAGRDQGMTFSPIPAELKQLLHKLAILDLHWEDAAREKRPPVKGNSEHLQGRAPSVRGQRSKHHGEGQCVSDVQQISAMYKSICRLLMHPLERQTWSLNDCQDM